MRTRASIETGVERMTSSDFLLPDLGEGLTDAEIIHWLVSVGDTVTVDQPVVEVETAKAAVEVPVPFAGKVTAIFGAPGERIPVGSPLITITTDTIREGDPISSEYSGNVLIGYGTSADPARRRGRIRKSSSPASADPALEAGLPATPRSSANPAVISPVVRKLARERGINLATIHASDPSGVIRRCDIEAIGYAETMPTNAMPTETMPTETMPTETMPTGTMPESTRIPLTGLRGLAAERLTRSRREIPEATVWVDVDATELLATRRTLNAAEPDRPISVLALVSRFCILGLRRYRELNSRVTADAIELLSQVNLGFAAQTSRGLLVPVVHDAQALTTRKLSAALSERTEAGRAGVLTPAQLSGGTFTINNYGVFGVDGSAAIINYPEVAMLGIGRIIDRPWVVDGQLAVRKVTELTLAFDHRACDGAVAGGFLRFVADCVQNPITALGEL